MRQTVDAIIDREGRVQLMGKVAVTQTRRALVTILDEVERETEGTRPDSIVGSVELLTDDLEADRRIVSQMFGDALSRSSYEIDR